MNTGADHILDLLKAVIDPELAVNIVDLGLVYDIRVSPDGNRIAVDMTLTSQACPLGEVIVEEVFHTLQSHFEHCEIDINLVWEPRWSTERMSPAGREAIG
jgi:metal-sulfur cluster biosynthetic enzyme